MDKSPPDGADGENGENENGGNELIKFRGVIDILCNARDKLSTQNVKTPAATKIKTEVLDEMSDAIEEIRMLRNIYTNSAIAGLDHVVKGMNELKASVEEIKAAKTASPWTTVVGSKTSATTSDTALANKAREQKRREQAKCEVTLVATTNEAKKKLSAMSYKEITEGIQTTINTNVPRDDKPVLFGVSKPTKEGTVRLSCKTEDDAKMLRELNWEAATKGLQARKPKYGIVIHAVPKDDFNILIDNNQSTIERIENENTFPIVKTAPLRRKLKVSPHHSIVLFTSDPYAADRCIKRGIYINYCLYPAERYAPQWHITQCYNCGKYGHRAAQCKLKHHCGKCGEDKHATNDCTNNGDPKCSNCGGQHENWNYECPTRIAEHRRLDNLRSQTSPYFTS
jgi:hypothetical protein